MKQIIKGLILIGLLMQANFILADIYRHQDEHGNISFSDKPSEYSTLVETLPKTYRYKHQVKRVYDGDTIILKNGEGSEVAQNWYDAFDKIIQTIEVNTEKEIE